jgi:uncharacterized protein (DUF952 family)
MHHVTQRQPITATLPLMSTIRTMSPRSSIVAKKNTPATTMPAPSPLPYHLYKILDAAPPSPLPARLPLSDLDRNDGYIHLSTADQVPGTADKFFSHVSALWLLKIKYAVLAAGTDSDGEVRQAAVRWEEVGRGCFAHFYHGDLGNGNVEAAYKVEKKGGTWTESLDLED